MGLGDDEASAGGSGSDSADSAEEELGQAHASTSDRTPEPESERTSERRPEASRLADAFDQALELSRRSVDELRGDVELSAEDDDLAGRLEQAKLARLEQANTLRNRFFALASLLASATVLTSVILVVAVVFGASIPTGVAIAFISGLALETVGVLAIMAGYLFPKERGAE